jgi:hypothetical protein
MDTTSGGYTMQKQRSTRSDARRTRVIVRVAAFLIALAAAHSPAGASGPFAGHVRWSSGESLFNFIPGGAVQGTFDLARTGNVLLVPDVYWGLHAYEILAPGEIALRDQLAMTPSVVTAVGDHAYVASIDTGFHVVEISPTALLSIVGTLPGSPPNDIAVQGDYAFTVDFSEFRTIAVGDPSQPTLVGSAPGDGVGIAVSASRAYVSRTDGLWTVDITDPAQPAFLQNVYVAQVLQGMVIRDGYLYVAQSSYGLRIFDLTDVDAPALVASVPFVGALAVTVEDGVALVGTPQEFLLVDVADPRLPVARALSRSAGALGSTIADGYVYLGSEKHGVQIMELGDGTSPQPIGSLATAAWGGHITSLGAELALITPSELQIVDVSQPDAPTAIGHLPLNLPQSMTGDGDYLYVVDAGGLRVVDASVRTAPSVVGTVPNVAGQLIAADAGRVYVSAISSLTIIDVSSPTQPALLSNDFAFPFGIEALTVDGYRVYTGTNFEGTGVVDLFDYTNPIRRELVVSQATPWISNLRYQDGAVYAAGLFHASALDATTLATRSTVGVHEFGGAAYASGLWVTATGRVATMNFWGGFHVFQDDATLLYVGSGSAPAEGGTAIAAVGDYVFLTDSTGLHVYEAPQGATGIESTLGSDGPAPSLTLRVAPNPSRGDVRFSWEAPAGREAGQVRIFDVQGRLVRELRGVGSGGSGEIRWDGTDHSGRRVPAGVFYARLSTGAGSVTRTVQIVR